MNPVASLFGSRKFLLMLLDLVVSVVLYFTAKYAGPSAFDDVKLLVAGLQPVFVTVITMIAVEDNAKAKNAAHVEIAKVQAASDLQIAKTTGRASLYPPAA